MKNSTILIIGVLIIIAWVFYNQKQESLSIIQNPITFTQSASLSQLNQPLSPLKVNLPPSVTNNAHTLILGSFFVPPFWFKNHPTDMTHFYITQYTNDWYIHLAHNPSSNAFENSIQTQQENEQQFTFNFIAIPIAIPIK
jgi:hypothetical protein